jgi:hypothetical protein
MGDALMTDRFHIVFEREGTKIDMMLPRVEIERADGIELVTNKEMSDTGEIEETLVGINVEDEEAFEEYIAMFMGGNDVRRQGSNIIPELVRINEV